VTPARARPGPAVAAAGGAIALWSLNAAAGGAVLVHLSVMQVLALQFGGAFVALAFTRAACRRGPARRGIFGGRVIAIGVIGLTGTIGLQYLAFATAPLIAANAIAYAWPLMAAAWAAVAPGAHGSRTSLMLAVVGFGGVVLLFSAHESNGPAGSAPWIGYVAALAMASYTLMAGHSGARTTDLLLVGTGAGALGTVPVALLQSAPWSPLWPILLSLGIGVVMLAIGYALWTHAMAHPLGERLAPTAYATPLLSTGLLLATGQRLSLLGLLGCGMIVLCASGVVLDAARGRPAEHLVPHRLKLP
jgi:drug/metabolite transporter (DMT)-like permease